MRTQLVIEVLFKAFGRATVLSSGLGARKSGTTADGIERHKCDDFGLP
jgi:hypothetical protein